MLPTRTHRFIGGFHGHLQPFVIIIQAKIKQKHVAAKLHLSRLAVSADKQRFTLTRLEAGFTNCYSRHYQLYSKSVNYCLTGGVKCIFHTRLTY